MFSVTIMDMTTAKVIIAADMDMVKVITAAVTAATKGIEKDVDFDVFFFIIENSYNAKSAPLWMRTRSK